MNKFINFAAGFLLASVTTASADDLPKLTIYTYDSFVSDWGPGPAIKKAFEKTCNCELNLVGAGDGAALLSRLQLEGMRTQADIALGLDTNLTARAASTGLFANHNNSLKNLNLPIDWSDDLFIPYDWGYFAFIYDNIKVKNPPKSFQELIMMPDDFKIVIQDPRSSTPGLGLLLWVKEAYPDRAAEIWKGLAPKILTVTAGWSEAYGMFTEGEADMVLSYTTSPAYHIIAENDETKSAANFDEGHYMQIEVAAKLASSKNPVLADKFLEFMTSNDFQSIIPTTNWMYPAVLPKNGLPDGFEKLISPSKSLLIPSSKAENVRSEALSEWLTALSQ